MLLPAEIPKFRFIRDDVFLLPYVDEKTGKQKLVMQQIDPNGFTIIEDSIDCIHTAVVDLQPDDIVDQVENGEVIGRLQKKILQIRSSETIQILNLNFDEKKKAFTSWVAGIAEAGKDAFFIQAQIEEEAKLAYPILSKLLEFLSRIDPEFISILLVKIQRECRFEGVYHLNSLIANLIPILEMLGNEKEFGQSNRMNQSNLNWKIEILDQIFEMNPPLSLFLDKDRAFFLKYEKATLLEDFTKAFSNEITEVRDAVSKNPHAIDFIEFKSLLYFHEEPSSRIRGQAKQNLINHGINPLQYLLKGNKDNEQLSEELPLWQIETELNNTESFDFYYKIEDHHITELGFYSSDLTKIPESFGNLVYLHELRINGHKNLTSLPESFGDLKSLERLYISNTGLQSLPVGFGRLKDLKRAYLDWNKISHLPESIGNIPDLFLLYLSNNQLSSLPESLLRLPLDFLSLEGNQFKNEPEIIGVLRKKGCRVKIFDTDAGIRSFPRDDIV
jgi:hypothetical protein